jgi:1,2-diacylglycerol 3-alpha-glucosyltransferase
MKLLFITPGFAAHENDDTCIPPLQALVRALIEKGAEVHIIALEYPFQKETYQWHGATVWPCNGQNRTWHKGITFLKAYWQAQKLAKTQHFDAIHSFWYGMATQVAARVARSGNIPHFITFMGQDVLQTNQKLRSIERADLAKTTKNWVVLSAFHRAELQKNGLDAGHTIPWGVLTSETPLAFPENRNIDVLGVGSLLPVKDWLRWLQVIRLVLDQKQEIQATLIGDGPLRQVIEDQIVALQLEAHVRCLGSLPRAEVLGYMRQAKVLLHTASFESFGYVFVEALQQGCRIVSTPVGIAPELPNSKVGRSDAELAELLLESIEADTLKAASLPFTIEESAERYLGIYKGTFR